MKCLLIGILLVGVQLQNDADADTDWELVKSQDGIKVYTRLSEGSDVKEYRAVTTVSCEMKTLESLIENVEDYPNWQENIATSSLLKRVNPNEKYVRYTTDLAWPISDRDAVVHSIKSVNRKGQIVFNMRGAPNYVKSTNSYIRVKNIIGKWQFTPRLNGKIEVLQQFKGDPGGNLPGWLINMLIVSGPFKTFSNIRDMVKLTK